MQLSDAGQQLATRPSPNPTLSPGWANNAPASSPPTISDPDWMNAVSAELLEFLILTDQAASKSNVSQVAAACEMLFGCYGIDSGSGNSYVVTPPVAVPALQDGQPVRFWTSRANTGAATLELAPLAAQPIQYANGSGALGAGTIVAGLNVVYWNAGLGAFLTRAPPPHGQTAITATGNFTVPAGVTSIFVRLAGGGGGGSGAAAGQQGGNGGAGGYAEGWLAVTPGNVMTATVGTGGGGVGANATGGTGGTTSFGAISATGGLGGENSASICPGGSPGVGGGGSLNLSGGYGDDGLVSSTAIIGQGGGGASYFGGGGRSGSGAGVAGLAPGSGGGAAYNNSGAGAAGAQGIIILSW